MNKNGVYEGSFGFLEGFIGQILTNEVNIGNILKIGTNLIKKWGKIAFSPVILEKNVIFYHGKPIF